MACQSCDSGQQVNSPMTSGQQAGVSKPLALNDGVSKPLQLSGANPASTPGALTAPGAGLSYQQPTGGFMGNMVGSNQPNSAPQSEHDAWLALPASTRAFMPEPGSQDAQYINDQANKSNAIFAAQGNKDPWATYANGQAPTGAPVTGGNYTVQAPPSPTVTQPKPPDAGSGYTAGTQGLSGPYGNVQTTLNNSNVPGLVGGDALAQMMKQAQEAAYKNASSYLDPQFQQQEQSLRSQLANQGIPQGSEAYTKAMDDFNRQKTFAYSQAQQNAVNQGNAAQNQLFGQGLAANQNQFGQNLSAGQFGNAAQNQMAQQLLQQLGINTQYGIAQMGNQLGNRSLDEQINQNNFNNSMGMRNQDINELLLQQQNPLQLLNMLMSGQNVQNPNFAQTPNANMGNTDIAGIQNSYMNGQNNNYNAQVGAQNSQNAGLTGLAGSALAAFMMF